MAAAAAQEEELDLDHGYTGIVNLGLTCYMNAPIQCLYHTRPLLNYILSPQYQQHIRFIDGNNTSGYVAFHFGALMCQLWSNKYSSVRPEPFRGPISRSSLPHARAMMAQLNVQHDSMEFYNCLIRLLDEDLVRSGEITPLPEVTHDPATVEPDELPENQINFGTQWYATQDNGTSKIHEIFSHLSAMEHRCMGCDYVRFIPDRSNFWLILFLEKKANNLEALFRSNWHGPRTLEGIYCRQCNAQMEYYSWFYRFPPILVIQLQRAFYDRKSERNLKQHDQIRVPEVLDLSPYVHEVVVDKKAVYRLYALIHHSGDSMDSGHYYAYVRTTTGWRLFNDTQVSDSSAENAYGSKTAQKNAFVYFYELQ